MGLNPGVIWSSDLQPTVLLTITRNCCRQWHSTQSACAACASEGDSSEKPWGGSSFKQDFLCVQQEDWILTQQNWILMFSAPKKRSSTNKHWVKKPGEMRFWPPKNAIETRQSGTCSAWGQNLSEQDPTITWEPFHWYFWYTVWPHVILTTGIV